MQRRDILKHILLGSGALVSGTTILTTMQASAAVKTTLWQPGYFSPPQYVTIERLVETILPKTNIPGAIEAGVPQYLDLLYKDIFDAQEKALAQKGLQNLDNLCDKKHNKSFAQLSASQQHDVLSHLYRQTEQFSQAFSQQKDGATLSDTHTLFLFLHSLRRLTIEGFYSSEVIGEKVLAYDPIPGDYQACTTIDNNTKVWSLH